MTWLCKRHPWGYDKNCFGCGYAEDANAGEKLTEKEKSWLKLVKK